MRADINGVNKHVDDRPTMGRAHEKAQRLRALAKLGTSVRTLRNVAWAMGRFDEEQSWRLYATADRIEEAFDNIEVPTIEFR